ncbi:MAG: hypothetical protein NT022_01610 [Deltaproteobacteria bacterium]|nr:hypothetical protein [Deltaproteobacteria bacterium]
MKMLRERILKVVTVVFIGSVFLLIGAAPVLSENLQAKISQCPQYVKAGQNLGAGFKVEAIYFGPLPVNDIVVDIVLRKDPCPPLPTPRPQPTTRCPVTAPLAVYSPHYSNGVLLKGGRETVNLIPTQWRQVKLNGTNTIPADTPVGDYFLCAVLDAGNKIAEVNEKDNWACCPVAIIKLKPEALKQKTSTVK